ncbi:hypothetical protein [uncultured Croceicoccus sp.]|uniref:hypothetical protein n=1 Tax=uncultured Croceicoccus sp. TaxID=1295329 RepID=UPI00262E2649|nr:hypothetical protein [uncultured Croceicoccus sp.]
MQQLATDFINFRGKFRIGGLIDVGTQMSLIRRANGRYLLIDSYGVEGEDRGALLGLTDNGAKIDAILNVHPFHTLHCEFAHRIAPDARLLGTKRHREKAPSLPWDDALIEDAATQAEFAEELEFSVPAGLELVPDNERVHAASVLVRHRESRIVHVDDTINVLAAPGVLKSVVPQSRLKFHPTVQSALEKRAGAADAFATWARDLAERWADTPTVCAAHSAVRQLPHGGWRDEILGALADTEKALSKHRGTYG